MLNEESITMGFNFLSFILGQIDHWSWQLPRPMQNDHEYTQDEPHKCLFILSSGALQSSIICDIIAASLTYHIVAGRPLWRGWICITIHHNPYPIHRSRPSVLLSVCVCVCLLVEHVLMVWVCRSIKAKGLWGEGTLQHRSREVRQCSGVFIHDTIVPSIHPACPAIMKQYNVSLSQH